MAAKHYALNVFVNCPFDEEYKSTLFPAIIFTIYDCGFRARSALENEDGAINRLENIFSIIKSSKFGIHDISRTELDQNTDLPRFNMPLELGAFMAAKKFGTKEQKQKKCLILDTDPHRYLSFISDIRGQDIKSHSNEIDRAIRHVRDWLNSNKPAHIMLPGHITISRRYNEYRNALPEATEHIGLDYQDLQFNDMQNLISVWINSNPK